MLSDAALAIAVDSDTKWLYNASRRLKRPLLRTLEDAIWWRLAHHLSGRVGIQLGEAARAADTLLSRGSDLGRVRLRATADDSVAVSIDLGRFHDGAALAIAAAIHLAVPRKRGRPLKNRPIAASPARDEPSSLGDASRVAAALEELDHSSPEIGEAGSGASGFLAALSQAGVPAIVVGSLAGVYYGAERHARSLDLVADLTPRPARLLSELLNRVGARPRGANVREGFAFEPVLIRSAACLALRIQGLAVNIVRAVPGIGEYPQVREASEIVVGDHLSYRVLSRSGLVRAAAGLARLSGDG
jgi:hypothetical protein